MFLFIEDHPIQVFREGTHIRFTVSNFSTRLECTDPTAIQLCLAYGVILHRNQISGSDAFDRAFHQHHQGKGIRFGPYLILAHRGKPLPYKGLRRLVMKHCNSDDETFWRMISRFFPDELH